MRTRRRTYTLSKLRTMNSAAAALHSFCLVCLATRVTKYRPIASAISFCAVWHETMWRSPRAYVCSSPMTVCSW